jgi:hypothetical protein
MTGPGPNAGDPNAEQSPFGAPGTPSQDDEQSRKKRALWLIGGLLGVGACVGSLVLLVDDTADHQAAQSVQTPSVTPSRPTTPTGEVPAPSPESPLATPEITTGTVPVAIAPVPTTRNTPAPARSPRSTRPSTVTPLPGVPAPSDVFVRLTTTKQEPVTPVPTQALSPGDSIANTVTIRNDGNVDLRYSMISRTTANDGDLVANVITMSVKVNVQDCTEAGYAATGTEVYRGPLGSYTGRNIVGDPKRGQDSGDRLLSPGEIETLCVKVDVPDNVGNEYQGKGTGVRFQFDSEDAS